MRVHTGTDSTHRGGRRWKAHALAAALGTGLLAASPAQAISITPVTDLAAEASILASGLMGPGVSLVPGTVTTAGVASQFGTFTGGAAEVGFDSGIVLSTGKVGQIPGSNTTGTTTPEELGVGDPSDDLSEAHGGGGDSDLEGISGGTTADAAVLQFDFELTGGGDLFFEFVFASEEYIDYVGDVYNDVFGFFVDGVNIALVPGTTDPITVNTVNPNDNSAFYINNVVNANGLPVAGRAIQFDGLTTVLTAEARNLGAGRHTIKIAIADTADYVLDSAVFIKAASFSTAPPPPSSPPPSPPQAPPTVPVPAPGGLWLLGAGLLGLGAFGRRRFG